MNVADYQDCYYDMSRRASEIGRTLSLAGLGLIWIFKLDQPAGIQLPAILVQAAALIIATLALDLLQYLYLAIAWLIVSYHYEKKHGHDKQGLSHPRWLPAVGEGIFFGKMITLLWGYVLLGKHLYAMLLIV